MDNAPTEPPEAPASMDLEVYASDLGTDVFAIDTRMSGYRGITASYLIRSERPCLVETGTATSAATVVAGVRNLGLDPEDLASIVVIHVHLDHAGGAGDLATAFPKAEIYVSDVGARHLVDPTRLVDSARRVFGRVLDEVFGVLRPVPRHRVIGISGGATLDLGRGRVLSVLDAPGHARHCVGLLDNWSGDLYVGDSAGIYIPETGDIKPATPPPDFDLCEALATLDRFRAADATRLLFSHFGPVPSVQPTLARAAEELSTWVETVRGATRGTEPDPFDSLEMAHVVQLLQQRMYERYPSYAADRAVVEKFEHLSSITANVAGVLRWLRKTQTLPSAP